MASRGIITEDREMLVIPVVRGVAIMQAGGGGAPTASGFLETKAGGYILTKAGIRIQVK